MDTTDPDDLDHDSALEASSEGTARRRPILAPLGELIADLSRARGGPMSPHREGGPPTHWVDEENLYMSFNLEGMERIDVDINICYGKVYIRVGR